MVCALSALGLGRSVVIYVKTQASSRQSRTKRIKRYENEQKRTRLQKSKVVRRRVVRRRIARKGILRKPK